jgi:YHYH protein
MRSQVRSEHSHASHTLYANISSMNWNMFGIAIVLSFGLAVAQNLILPVGDGRISSEAKADFVFSCQQRFPSNPPGAFKAGAWLNSSTWEPRKKPVVDGTVAWPDSNVQFKLEGAKRTVKANNLPTHTTGIFPIQTSDDAYQFDRNPNPIRAQRINLELPAKPKLASRPSCLPMGLIGFTVTGVAVYNALDAGGRDAGAHEIQDACNGHPERSGQYHYHDWSSCQPDTSSQNQSGKHSDLIGYALDGFGLYGLNNADGTEITNSSLDECHGHTHEITWDGKPQPLYHYHMTRAYPYTLGCFRGTPASQ